MGDALSTALFVMGEEKACKYWKTNDDFEMILVTDDGRLILTEEAERNFIINSAFDSMQIQKLVKDD